MRATMLLADAAQTVGGKLYILGGGWTICGPGPAVMALAIKLEIPADQAGQAHDWSLTLLNDSGERVLLEAPDGQQLPVEISGKFEATLLPDLPPEIPLDLPIAVTVGPLPLPPGSHFVWQLSIDGQTSEEWQLAFWTRPTTPPSR
jgi:hypothetical protein